MDCQPFASQSTWTSRGNISQITSLIKRPAVWNGLKPKNLESSEPPGNSLNQVECLATLTRRPGRRDTPAPLHLLAFPCTPVQCHPPWNHQHHQSHRSHHPLQAARAPLNYWSPDLLQRTPLLLGPVKDELLALPLFFRDESHSSGVVGRGDDGGCSFAFRGEWAGLLVVDRRSKDDSNFKCNPLFSRECVSMLRL